MRFMVMVRATADSEADIMPSAQLLADMGRYNERLLAAGVLLAGEGIKGSRHGVRVHFSGADRRIEKGPFPTSEVVAGYWLFACASMEECIDWVRQCPNPMIGDSDIEIRPLFEAEDFA